MVNCFFFNIEKNRNEEFNLKEMSLKFKVNKIVKYVRSVEFFFWKYLLG